MRTFATKISQMIGPSQGFTQISPRGCASRKAESEKEGKVSPAALAFSTLNERSRTEAQSQDLIQPKNDYFAVIFSEISLSCQP
jgi:hypothetical protein